uniref:Peptidase A1 domain-containing protein n=1 Tax=Moniliophthora roreri TaxID=221103 RepID=A0A0W0FJQ2_MONRR
MALSLLSFILASSSVVSAVRFPVKQIRPSLEQRSSDIYTRSHFNFPVLAAGDGSDNGLNTVHDLLYMANISVGGNDYMVQLDTGSSDLWLKGNTFPLPNSSQTSHKLNITYGIGWAYGTISTATVEFADIRVTDQAYLDTSVAQNPALSYGAYGVMGLGFTSLSSIDAELNKTGSSSGRSLLFNMFEDNPSEPNFIAFAMQRSTHDDSEVEGSFSIGEYDPKYQAVANAPRIPTWPEKHPTRWNVILEALHVGTQTTIPTTTVPDVPSNRAVVLLDSGTSWTYAPVEICDAIYGGVPGARYDNLRGQWVVPCDAEVDIAIQIQGQVFPIHPLDVNPKDMGDPTKCVGSFVPQTFSIGAGKFDWLVGDNVLRSMYSVYDFGDYDSNHQMGDPYVQLLSLVDPNKASAEFVKERGGTAKTNINYPISNVPANAASSTSVVLSADVAQTIAKIGQFFPAILGIVALNALVLLALIILGAVFLCKRRRKKARRNTMRTPMGRMTPMPYSSRRNSVVDPDQSHIYEPVSMALTEDTVFVPPSPGFKKLDGSRPKSFAPTTRSAKTSMSMVQDPNSEDAIFGSPSPGFREFEEVGENEPQNEPFVLPQAPYLQANASQNRGDRPMSVGILPSQHSPHYSPPELGVPFPGQGQQQPIEQDITFVPPQPAFHGERSSPRSGNPSRVDRPQSVA